MLRIIKGLVEVKSTEEMVKISNIVNSSPCQVESEEEDFIFISWIDQNAIQEVIDNKLVEPFDLNSVDELKFYLV